VIVVVLEVFVNEVGLLPEQVWDRSDLSRWHFKFGRQIGAAMPLMWVHVGYIKLFCLVCGGVIS